MRPAFLVRSLRGPGWRRLAGQGFAAIGRRCVLFRGRNARGRTIGIWRVAIGAHDSKRGVQAFPPRAWAGIRKAVLEKRAPSSPCRSTWQDSHCPRIFPAVTGFALALYFVLRALRRRGIRTAAAVVLPALLFAMLAAPVHPARTGTVHAAMGLDCVLAIRSKRCPDAPGIVFARRIVS